MAGEEDRRRTLMQCPCQKQALPLTCWKQAFYGANAQTTQNVTVPKAGFERPHLGKLNGHELRAKGAPVAGVGDSGTAVSDRGYKNPNRRMAQSDSSFKK